MKRVPLKSRIALKGDIPLHWRSLYRTRNFFECALKDRCSLVDEVAIADAELIFSDAQPFSRTAPEDPPRVVAIHGGAVIDYKRLNVFLEGIRECDCLLVNCTSDVNLLRSFLRGSSPDIVLLPLPSWRATYNSLSVKEICFIPSSRKLIVFVARLVPMKNVHSFIQVVAHLSRSHDIHAIIVGDYWDDYPVLRSSQSYRSYIGRLTTSRVLEDRITRLDGSIPDDLLQAIVSQADLLIHPTVSIDENFGYVPLDALTSGTPVVGTHYGGLKETFQCLPDMSATTWATPSGIRVDYHSLANMANRVLRKH
jgi:glycosyltransferase involved in cell wall biosynthesis